MAWDAYLCYPMALTFLEPAILLGLPAVIIPVIIHLWNRKKYADMEWAAMQFVIAALAIEKRRILLRELLLLFIRTAIISLLVVAAARPVMQSPVTGISYHAATGWIFVIDNSLSMQQRGSDGSCLQMAKKVVQRLVGAAGPGDMFCLLEAHEAAQWQVELALGDREAFLRNLDEMAGKHRRDGWTTTFRTVLERLRRLKEEQPQLTRFVVLLVTDGQRWRWDVELRDRRSELRSLIREIAATAELVFCTLGTTEAINRAVMSLRVSPAACVRNEEILVTGDVVNFGPVDDRPNRIEFSIDSQKVGETSLNWETLREASFIWSYRTNVPGDHVLEAILAGDSLEEDNHRRIVVQVKDQIQVLCIDGRYSPVPFDGATDYVRLALAPSADAPQAMSSSLRLETVSEGRLGDSNIYQFDIVILCDVAQLTRGEGEILESFVRNGGGLAIFCGSRIRPESYNLILGSHKTDGQQFWPGRLEKIIEPADATISQVDENHPLFQLFAGRDEAGVEGAPVRGYVRFVGHREYPHQIVGLYSNQDPFIATWNYGMGRVVLVTTSGDPRWTSLPLWPAWVPFIQELKNYLQETKVEARTLTCGRALALALPLNTSPVPPVVRMQHPLGQTRREVASLEQGFWRWAFGETDWAGVYHVQVDRQDQPTDTLLFAVNVPVEESDLRRDEIETFLRREVPEIRVISEGELTQLSSTSSPTTVGARTTLPSGLLLAALILAVCEVVVARWRRR